MPQIDFPIKILMVMHTSAVTGPNMATLSLLKAIDRSSYRIEVASPGAGDLVGCLKDIGIPHIPLEFGRYTDLITLLRLISILRKGKYHILHGHMGRVGPIICIAGKIARVPAIILTEHMSAKSHAWMGNNFIRLFFHRLFHFVSNNCLNMVIAVSEKARRNYVLRQGIREEKTAAIYNSIYLEEKKDYGRITIRRELGLSESATVIGMFGRLIKEKGYSDVVLAAGEVLRHTRNVQFLVVGEGAERENLEALVKSKGLEKNVIFAGFRQDTSNIMESIDLLVQPSWTESNESFGLVLIEAMAAGKPVIASNIEPFFEVVEDGKSGLLFPEKNHKALAQKLLFLLNDRALMEKMGRCGYEVIKEKFDARIIARKTEDVYKQVLRIKK